ncbi:hypothetical protein Q6A90_05075 [Aliarcobacter skirrowii]|jgi:hypothetical protein|uniref:hypothetical protein n=1 Tax=Aliarcobacter skirrowii TaxID=28200 RepID=UPI0008310101|nr:hypothetical protein [Aliarcobacter skirrowii]MDD2508704.1 hypothetical protein [Aliarcobacter skirrowii]MDD3496916.1 hypothetical protein [Aliarcobacter skirrowii]MDX4048388.1 hypothetical protein [Aliarcobacter skirrowii]MDX4051053.1 hypothetical protein [Aliarcobacter skirrowii]MDX4061735.1 hypothetical protein [Aliarcobacter skirrowii]
MRRAKKYFSFFGILISTCFEKLHIFYSKLIEYLRKLPNIQMKLLNIKLKPIKTDLINNN